MILEPIPFQPPSQALFELLRWLDEQRTLLSAMAGMQ